jgi:hypothetical protein
MPEPEPASEPRAAEAPGASPLTGTATARAASPQSADSPLLECAPAKIPPIQPPAPPSSTPPGWPGVAPVPGHAAGAEPTPAATPVPVVFGEPRRFRPWWWLAGGAGVLLIAAQVLWYRFDEWSVDPFWRDVYAPICVVVGCTLPVQRDLDSLSTRQLAVRSHPDQPGSLQVSAVIVNEAEFTQPFPTLEIRFTTTRGLLVAGRRFPPEEYLAGEALGMAGLPPRTPVQIELVIDDPGPDAVNYFLRFR